MTSHLAKGPALHDVVDGKEVHGDEADEGVGDGQVDDEDVEHGLQALLRRHGNHHQEVAHHRHLQQGIRSISWLEVTPKNLNFNLILAMFPR